MESASFSSSAVTRLDASSICRGSCGTAAEVTKHFFTSISTSLWVQLSILDGAFFTVAYTSTMLSLEILQKNSNFRSPSLAYQEIHTFIPGDKFDHLLTDVFRHEGDALYGELLLSQHEEALLTLGTAGMKTGTNPDRLKVEKGYKNGGSCKYLDISPTPHLCHTNFN